MENLDHWLVRVGNFKRAANELLGLHEESKKTRVITLEKTYTDLSALNLKQDDLFKQALRCAENELYRAAHVMAWAACMDFIQEKIAEDGLIALRREYPKWKGVDISEIAEYVPEAQLVDALKKINLATKNQAKSLAGLLHRRNQCAHPSEYLPEVNETLGYMSEILQSIKTLSRRKAK